MNREKLFINAFVLSVFILCLISTIGNNNEINQLVYALIIPVFLITIIEFIIEIKEKCEKYADKVSKEMNKMSQLEYELAEEKVKNLKIIGNFDENNLPESIQKNYEDSIKHTNIATNYIKVSTDFVKLHKFLKIIYTIILVLFFLSIIFFSKISSVLEKINLNSISLWSLLLLLISIYNKDDVAIKIVEKLYKCYEKK